MSLGTHSYSHIFICYRKQIEAGEGLIPKNFSSATTSVPVFPGVRCVLDYFPAFREEDTSRRRKKNKKGGAE